MIRKLCKIFWIPAAGSMADITTEYDYGDTKDYDRVVGLYFYNGTSKPTSAQRQVVYTYDDFGRRTNKVLNLNTDLVTTYAYWDETGGHLSSRVRTVTNGNDEWSYDYDDEGNIITVSRNGSFQHMYNYDSLGQLIEDWDFATESVIRYTYDAGGNILKKETYANWNLNSTPTTVNYTYDNNTWKDLLTNFNGTSISYDNIGNPINWRENIIFSWSNGRELSGVYKNGATHSYAYDSDGTRIRKTTGGVTTTYYVQDGVCYGETRSDGVSLQYLRDETGKVIGLRYQNDGIAGDYYFVFNLQGDVVQIVDSTGAVMANYTYDTWGKLISATDGFGNAFSLGNVGRYNPFLYRGYYYDYETGFYYLQSRYYDPVVGRFLNADVQLNTNSLLGYNMFAYCENNPVNMVDYVGNEPEWIEDLRNWWDEEIAQPLTELAGYLLEDLVNYDSKNTDVGKVYKAHFFSSYNGAFVIRHSSEYLTSWAIFGTIFLNHSGDELNPTNQENNLKHEYGHILQEESLGLVDYLTYVAVPSVIYNVASRFNDSLNDNYYNMPWEYDADKRGGVHREHAPWAAKISRHYNDFIARGGFM